MSGVLREPDRPDGRDQNDTGPGDVEMLSERGLNPPDDLGEVSDNHQGCDTREPGKISGDARQNQTKEWNDKMNEYQKHGEKLPAG